VFERGVVFFKVEGKTFCVIVEIYDNIS
jgi:hypothetical protein